MSESIGAAAGELRRIADAAPSGEVADLGDTIERVRDQLGELIGAEHGVPELPARVQGKRDKTVGRIKINDRSLPVPIESGMDTWSDHAGERMRVLGIPEYLRSHVEMKLATLMINTGAQHGEAVINHAPCGSEPSARGGCHASLEQFIPQGHSLTVHGTTAQGRAFTSTYRGRA